MSLQRPFGRTTSCGRIATVLTAGPVADQPHWPPESGRAKPGIAWQMPVNIRLAVEIPAVFALAGALLSSERLSQAQ